MQLGRRENLSATCGMWRSSAVVISSSEGVESRTSFPTTGAVASCIASSFAVDAAQQPALFFGAHPLEVDRDEQHQDEVLRDDPQAACDGVATSRPPK